VNAPSPPLEPSRFALHKVVAVGIGNALEFYDFLAFSFFSIQIGHAFFPAGETSHGLLYTLATFGIGFLTRPLGGIVIGRYADRAGRRPAMFLSLALMGVAILGVALTPPFAVIGVAAPILLLVFRLAQGFAMGGSVGTSTAYLVEAAPPERRGLYVSLQYATQDLSILVAGLVGFALSSWLSPAALDAWGWRIAFLLGVSIVPLGLWMRRNLPETFAHGPARPEAARAPSARPAVPWRLVALGFVLLSSGTITSYVLTYLTTYAQDSLGLAVDLAFLVTISVGLSQMVFDLVAGALCDRFGRRPVLLLSMSLLLAVTVPLFVLLNRGPGLPVMLAAIGLLGALVSLTVGPTLIMITESLPAAIRCGTLGTLYAVAIATFGGSTQVVVKWLTDATGSTLAPAWYMTGALAAGTCAAWMMGESHPRLSRSGGLGTVQADVCA
jgi:MHS family citrate/tricarballylate:H+ symporter-like MFS transporter